MNYALIVLSIVLASFSVSATSHVELDTKQANESVKVAGFVGWKSVEQRVDRALNLTDVSKSNVKKSKILV